MAKGGGGGDGGGGAGAVGAGEVGVCECVCVCGCVGVGRADGAGERIEGVGGPFIPCRTRASSFSTRAVIALSLGDRVCVCGRDKGKPIISPSFPSVFLCSVQRRLPYHRTWRRPLFMLIAIRRRRQGGTRIGICMCLHIHTPSTTGKIKIIIVHVCIPPKWIHCLKRRLQRRGRGNLCVCERECICSLPQCISIGHAPRPPRQPPRRR